LFIKSSLKHFVRTRMGAKFYYNIINFPFSFFLLLCLCILLPAEVLAAIRFKDVTTETEISYKGPSYGASWGDFNNDGWPDLWVGNHNSTPALYLNKQDGSFENIINQVWNGDSKEDTHGAQWADFDNDGDQDLIELDNARENDDGTFCRGCGKNNFFINDQGKLWERAGQYNLDSEGLARSPLWFDADRDGLLDLLVVNTRRSGHPLSTLYMQKNNRFRVANEMVGFRDGPLQKSEKIWGRIHKLMNFEYPSIPYFKTQRHLEFAQLADLSSNGYPELILHSNPTRVYAIDTIPFRDITNDIGLPDQSQILDVAIADFNGDRKMDMYVARGEYMPADVVRTSPSEIKGYITCAGTGPPKAVLFQAEGEVQFQIYPTWLPLTQVYIGSVNRHPASRLFTLSPDNPDVFNSAPDNGDALDGVLITYSPDSRTWTIRNFHRSIFIDFKATAAGNLSTFTPVNFELFREKGRDSLFLRKEDGFVEKKMAGEAGMPTSCYFAVAGDFDNDMDIDLYLSCTGSARNLANRLLENNGQGEFHLVPDAGGAAGSLVGRGDAVAVADYDRDGFLDLFVANGHDPASPLVADGPHQLFHNQGNTNHWLEIDLQGVTSNRDGIGSRVELVVNGITQVRDQTGGMHRITQNHQRLHFGLGKYKQADRLTVRWPSGIVQQLNNIEADRILRVSEPLQKTP
jgi:hypothetical protein